MSTAGPDLPKCVEHQIDLAQPAPAILSTGAWFKNTVCLTHDRQAWVSHTVGDLFQAEACLAHEATVRELLAALATTGGRPAVSPFSRISLSSRSSSRCRSWPAVETAMFWPSSADRSESRSQCWRRC